MAEPFRQSYILGKFPGTNEKNIAFPVLYFNNKHTGHTRVLHIGQ